MQDSQINKCACHGCDQTPETKVNMDLGYKVLEHYMCWQHFIETRQLAEYMTRYDLGNYAEV